MKARGSIDPFDASGLGIRPRLDKLFGRKRLPTGTTTAHALHDLFLSEARQRGMAASVSAWAALDDLALKSLGDDLRRFVWDDGARFALPAGTETMAGMTGCMFIGDDILGFDVDRSGLHAARDLPADPGGSNLELLIRLVEELSAPLPCRALGVPELVSRYDGHRPTHHLRFQPSRPAAGAVLRRAMDQTSWGDFFCSFSKRMVRELAREIVHDMTEVWTSGHHLAELVGRIRREARRIAVSLPDVRVHAITIDTSPHLNVGEQFSIEFEAWNHAFRRGIATYRMRPLQGHVTAVDFGTLDRSSRVGQVRALGVDGWISGLARAIVRAAPQGPAAALATLSQAEEAFVTLNTADASYEFRLNWREGEILASTEVGRGIDVTESLITLNGHAIPETLVSALPGKPFHHVLDAPFRCDTPIAHLENKYGNLAVRLAPDPWLVDCATGRMWPTSAARLMPPTR